MKFTQIVQIIRDIFHGGSPARRVLARMLLAMALAIILSAVLILRMR